MPSLCKGLIISSHFSTFRSTEFYKKFKYNPDFTQKMSLMYKFFGKPGTSEEFFDKTKKQGHTKLEVIARGKLASHWSCMFPIGAASNLKERLYVTSKDGKDAYEVWRYSESEILIEHHDDAFKRLETDRLKKIQELKDISTTYGISLVDKTSYSQVSPN